MEVKKKGEKKTASIVATRLATSPVRSDARASNRSESFEGIPEVGFESPRSKDWMV